MCIILIISLAGCSGTKKVASEVADAGLDKMADLEPSNMLPDQCRFGTGFVCLDAEINEEQVSIEIENGFGTDIVIQEMSSEIRSPPSDCMWKGEQTMTKGSSSKFILTGDHCLHQDEGKMKLDLKIKYYNTNSGELFAKESIGDLIAKVE